MYTYITEPGQCPAGIRVTVMYSSYNVQLTHVQDTGANNTQKNKDIKHGKKKGHRHIISNAKYRNDGCPLLNFLRKTENLGENI